MNRSYSELKALLENPDVDAKTKMALPEAIRYVYFRYPRLESVQRERSLAKTLSAFRIALLLLFAWAAWYEGLLSRVLPLFLLLGIYEFSYASRRLESIESAAGDRWLEYDLRKRLLLSPNFER